MASDALDREPDVIVVGAGHNGLVAACYLAKAGLTVLVVEAAPAIGGMTTSANVIPEAPRHKINLSSTDVIFMRVSTIPQDLRLARYGYRTVDPDPPYAYLHPDGASVAFWRDPRRTADEIRRFAPRDAEAYLEFARAMDALMDLVLPFMLSNPTRPGGRAVSQSLKAAVRHLGRLRPLSSLAGSLATSSALQLIEERFRHEVVRSAVGELAAFGAPITSVETGWAGLVAGILHRFGIGRPVGGTQSLVDALAGCLADSGGSVRTSAPVEEIIVRGGRARGVRIVGGEEISARFGVLASCDPRTTLERLVPSDALPPRIRARVRHIPTNAHRAASMLVHVALSGRLDLKRHRQWRLDGLDMRIPTVLVGTTDGICRSFVDAASGFLPDDIQFWGVVPTALDPTQAPEGQETLYLWIPVMPASPREPWEALAPAAGKAVLARAGDFYDGLEHLEIGRFVETPAAMAQRLRVTGGCIFHVDFNLSRLGPLRPALGLAGYRTPIERLYLSGAGTHPGGGISGIPGQLAAREVQRDIRR